MRDDGFIDLTADGKLWRWHRLSAVILIGLVIAHLTLRLPAPVGIAAEAWRLGGNIAEDALLGALGIVAIFHAAAGIRLFLRLCPMLWPRRGQRSFMTWCIAAERYSGFALTAFLVLHFCLLCLAASVVPDLDGWIRRAGGPLVTVAEGLVLMGLLMHGIGGIRVLIQEFFSTHRLDRPLGMLAAAAALAAPVVWHAVAVSTQ